MRLQQNSKCSYRLHTINNEITKNYNQLFQNINKRTKSSKIMQCPYFKKVNFHRIQPRTDTEQDLDKINQVPKNNYQFRNSQFQSAEDSIPEEGCTNNIKVENYKKVTRYDSNSSCVDQSEDLEKIITIKMPKTLEIKQFNIEDKKYSQQKENIFVNFNAKGKPYELPQISQQICSAQSEQIRQKEAKIFETHRNLFFENAFYSVAYLPKTSEYCFCQLNQSFLKIVYLPKTSKELQINKTDSVNKYNSILTQIKENSYPNQSSYSLKTKYFVEIKKFKLDLSAINDKTLQIAISINRGTDKQIIEIQFLNQNERCTFQCVYLSIMEDMNSCNMKKSEKANKTNRSEEQSQLSFDDSKIQRSIDSLKFTVERMSYYNSLDYLNTFDIILFKGRNIMSKFQRFFTNSQFDHVGLILKTAGESLLLLQATGNVGVAIYSYSSIKAALKKKLYQRIAIRKFFEHKQKKNKKSTKLLALQQFIGQVNGKKYKFDPMYLISSAISKKKQHNENIEQSGEQQTYFCSQLVAQALKISGILKDIKPSYKYLPKHFGDTDGLNHELHPGFHYSEPIILQK